MKGIIFIGLQASGKSSFYLEKFYKTHIRLNLDMLKTRNREKILFEACLVAKQPLVIDNTNPTIDDRKRYIGKLREHRFKISGYYFQSNIEQCLARNKQRTGKEKIPEVGIKATYRKLQLPTYTEGFDRLYYVKIQSGKFIIEDWQNEI